MRNIQAALTTDSNPRERQDLRNSTHCQETAKCFQQPDEIWCRKQTSRSGDAPCSVASFNHCLLGIGLHYEWVYGISVINLDLDPRPRRSTPFVPCSTPVSQRRSLLPRQHHSRRLLTPAATHQSTLETSRHTSQPRKYRRRVQPASGFFDYRSPSYCTRAVCRMTQRRWEVGRLWDCRTQWRCVIELEGQRLVETCGMCVLYCRDTGRGGYSWGLGRYTNDILDRNGMGLEAYAQYCYAYSRSSGHANERGNNSRDTPLQ